MTLNQFFSSFKNISLYLITMIGAAVALIAFGLGVYSHVYFQLPSQILSNTNEITNLNKRTDNIKTEIEKNIGDMAIKNDARFAAEENRINEIAKEVNNINANLKALDVKVEQRVIPRLRQQGDSDNSEILLQQLNVDTAATSSTASSSRRASQAASSVSSQIVLPTSPLPVSSSAIISTASSLPTSSSSNDTNLREFLRQEIRVAIREALQVQPCTVTDGKPVVTETNSSETEIARARLRERLNNSSTANNQETTTSTDSTTLRERLQERRELVRTGAGEYYNFHLFFIIAVSLLVVSIFLVIRILKRKL